MQLTTIVSAARDVNADWLVIGVPEAGDWGDDLVALDNALQGQLSRLREAGDLTGKLAENTLIKADITINKNMVPFDDKSPMVTSGMRVGTAAMTTRGLNESDMERIVVYIDEVLMNHDNDAKIQTVKEEINEWMKAFPLYA